MNLDSSLQSSEYPFFVNVGFAAKVHNFSPLEERLGYYPTKEHSIGSGY